jgi:hypothetical protein
VLDATAALVALPRRVVEMVLEVEQMRRLEPLLDRLDQSRPT